MQKRVTISIDKEVNERWTKVAKRLDLSKSGMVEEFIEQMLPILEAETPNKMMAKAMQKMAVQIDTTATLFDDIENDEFDSIVHDARKKDKLEK